MTRIEQNQLKMLKYGAAGLPVVHSYTELSIFLFVCVCVQEETAHDSVMAMKELVNKEIGE